MIRPMDKEAERIVSGLAHAKDAAKVLEHINLDHGSPAEAGARAEIIAADALLAKGIERLEALKEEKIKEE